MKKRLAICDCDEQYRQMMQVYWMKRLPDFEIITFGDCEQAAEYSKKETFSLLLVSESLYGKKLGEIGALQTFILREDGTKEITEYPYVEKYQSMEKLMRNVLEHYSEERDRSNSMKYRNMKIHAFYSPIRRKEQTKMSLALGQILAGMNKKVLYLNLQPFAGWEETLHISTKTDITDLLYFNGRQDNRLLYRLQSMKQSLGGVDCLAPAMDYMDLLKIPEQEWLMLLDKIAELDEYDEMILDLSEICQGLYQILEHSSYVYSMREATEEERVSVVQYKRLLEKRELSTILEKTIWMALPQRLTEQTYHLERLSVTPFGEYMKEIMKKHENRQI